MMYDANKSIQVSAYLLPEEVVGNLPMVSIVMQAKGTFGISKCSWEWHTMFGRFFEQVVQLLM